MDRLVKPEVKEVNLAFNRSQKCSTTFTLTYLMHTMSVAVSLTTTNSSLFSFKHALSVIPPLSTASFTLLLSQPSDQPPLSTPLDTILVRSAMLPTGKAHQDNLRRLFSKPGPHIFKDATIPISVVGPQVIEFLLSPPPKTLDIAFLLSKAIAWCDESQLTGLLRSAATSGNSYFVSSLINAGADVNNQDSDGRPVISLAVQSGNIDVVHLLIQSGNVSVNLFDLQGQTALHVAAICGQVEALQFLVSVGGDPEITDCNGWSPLHFASIEGHLEAVEFLLNCSTYVKYAVTKEGKTAFVLAVDKGQSHLYDLLQLGDVLHRAARIADVDGMKSYVAEGGKVNGRDQNGWTPLHRAAFKGRIESVKLLLNHGAQVDDVDDAGYTPLQCAVEAGHVQVALYLIAQGARANMKSVIGVVPLNLDSFKNHPSLVTPSCQERERERERESLNPIQVVGICM